MITQLFSGAGYFFRGISLMMKPGIRHYVLIPLLINIVLFVGVSYYIFSHLGIWTDQMLPSWLEWLSWVLVPLFGLAFIIVGFFSFSIIGNLVASPFNGYLSAAVEAYLTGKKISEESYGNMMKEVGRTIVNELRKFVYFALWAIPVLILSLIPFVNILALAITAWLLSLEYCDYPYGNHSVHFAEVRENLARKRPAALGFGGIVVFVTSIPVVNLFVMPAAVAGATALYVEKLREIPAGA
jgi:CysZ protein